MGTGSEAPVPCLSKMSPWRSRPAGRDIVLQRVHPVVVDVRAPLGNEHEIDGAIAENLIRDGAIGRFGVSGPRCHTENLSRTVRDQRQNNGARGGT